MSVQSVCIRKGNAYVDHVVTSYVFIVLGTSLFLLQSTTLFKAIYLQNSVLRTAWSTRRIRIYINARLGPAPGPGGLSGGWAVGWQPGHEPPRHLVS